jgi:hypothetical protein
MSGTNVYPLTLLTISNLKMMTNTTVVNLRFDSYDVYIGRHGKGKDGYFGNPFKLKPHESGGSTIERFRKYFYDRLKADHEFKNRVHELKGKKLGCFCKPSPCHGDVIAEYLNRAENPQELNAKQ